jgi:hypothetical protein
MMSFYILSGDTDKVSVCATHDAPPDVQSVLESLLQITDAPPEALRDAVRTARREHVELEQFLQSAFCTGTEELAAYQRSSAADSWQKCHDPVTCVLEAPDVERFAEEAIIRALRSCIKHSATPKWALSDALAMSLLDGQSESTVVKFSSRLKTGAVLLFRDGAQPGSPTEGDGEPELVFVDNVGGARCFVAEISDPAEVRLLPCVPDLSSLAGAEGAGWTIDPDGALRERTGAEIVASYSQKTPQDQRKMRREAYFALRGVAEAELPEETKPPEEWDPPVTMEWFCRQALLRRDVGPVGRALAACFDKFAIEAAMAGSSARSLLDMPRIRAVLREPDARAGMRLVLAIRPKSVVPAAAPWRLAHWDAPCEEIRTSSSGAEQRRVYPTRVLYELDELDTEKRYPVALSYHHHHPLGTDEKGSTLVSWVVALEARLQGRVPEEGAQIGTSRAPVLHYDEKYQLALVAVPAHLSHREVHHTLIHEKLSGADATQIDEYEHTRTVPVGAPSLQVEVAGQTQRSWDAPMLNDLAEVGVLTDEQTRFLGAPRVGVAAGKTTMVRFTEAACSLAVREAYATKVWRKDKTSSDEVCLEDTLEAFARGEPLRDPLVVTHSPRSLGSHGTVDLLDAEAFCSDPKAKVTWWSGWCGGDPTVVTPEAHHWVQLLRFAHRLPGGTKVKAQAALLAVEVAPGPADSDGEVAARRVSLTKHSAYELGLVLEGKPAELAEAFRRYRSIRVYAHDLQFRGHPIADDLDTRMEQAALAPKRFVGEVGITRLIGYDGMQFVATGKDGRVLRKTCVEDAAQPCTWSLASAVQATLRDEALVQHNLPAAALYSVEAVGRYAAGSRRPLELANRSLVEHRGQAAWIDWSEDEAFTLLSPVGGEVLRTDRVVLRGRGKPGLRFRGWAGKEGIKVVAGEAELDPHQVEPLIEGQVDASGPMVRGGPCANELRVVWAGREPRDARLREATAGRCQLHRRGSSGDGVRRGRSQRDRASGFLSEGQ